MSAQQSIVLGADPGACDLVFDQPAVSSQHAQLWRGDDGQLYVADMHSTNGTALNGEWLEPNQSYPIRVGDTLALGTSFAFQLEANHLRGLAPAASAAASLSLAPQVASSETHTAVRFGRDGSMADVVVHGDGVSGCHFEIRRSGSGYVAEDLGSTNGTFIGDRQLTVGTPVAVRLGDRIRLGQHTTIVLQAEHVRPLGEVVRAPKVARTKLEEVPEPASPKAPAPPPAPAPAAEPARPVVIREERPAPVVVVRESSPVSKSSGGAGLALLVLLGVMFFTNPTRQDFENHVVDNKRARGELSNQVKEALTRAWVRDLANRAGRKDLAIACVVTVLDDRGKRHRWIGMFKSFFKVPA